MATVSSFAVQSTTLALAVIACPMWVSAQVEPLEEGAGNRPTATAPVDDTPAFVEPHPRLHLFTDRADTVEQGWFELEGGWQTDFIACGVGGLGERCDRNAGVLLASLAPVDFIEARLGWYFVGIQGSPAGDITGVGDLFAEVKGEIPLPDLEDPDMHHLSVLGHIRPGMAQDPVTTRGLDLAAYAVYSTFPSVIRVDVQAGFRFVGLFDDGALYQMPLSGAVTWRAVDWLDVYGEFVEALTFNDLNNSQTSLGLGVGFLPLSRLAVNVGTRIGLTENLPNATLALSVTGLLGRLN